MFVFEFDVYGLGGCVDFSRGFREGVGEVGLVFLFFVNSVCGEFF